METRSNHVLVGGVVVALVAIGLVFIAWMSQFNNGHQQPYDIFFKSSVDGLAKGSAVTYSGVPVGKIDAIRLLPDSPELVRVRISVDDNTPILQGTTATVSSVGFTGVSQINLSGGRKGAPPLTDIGPFGVPVIPTKPGLVGQLLNTAPELLNKISTLTDRLSALVDQQNQHSIQHILANFDTLSTELAGDGPELKRTLVQTQATLRDASAAVDQIGKLAGNTNQLLDSQGKPILAHLDQTLAAANHSVQQLDALIAEAQPGVKTLSTQTAPDLDQLVRNLNEMSRSLTEAANRLNSGGVGGVLGGRKLPTYKPGQ